MTKRVSLSLAVILLFNEILLAQAFPLYKEVKTKAEKSLKSSPSNKIKALSPLSSLVLSPFSYMAYRHFEEIPLESLTENVLVMAEIPPQEQELALDLEAQEWDDLVSISTKRVFSLTIGPIIAGSFLTFLGSGILNPRVKVQYVIQKEKGNKLCSGMEEINVLVDSKTDWKHLEKICDIAPGEAYFLRIVDFKGKVIMTSKKIISQ